MPGSPRGSKWERFPDSKTAKISDDKNDADGDGIHNKLDLDSDGDGIPDHFECDGGNDANLDGVTDNFTDNDKDGHNDIHDESEGGDPINCVDTDGDGKPDFIDHDSDNDGFTDAEEAGGIDQDMDGIHDDSNDSNGDGLADSVHPITGIPHPIPDSNAPATR